MKRRKNSDMKNKSVLIGTFCIILFTGMIGCNKFLNIVPDNVATLDHAFHLRNEAEKYLFTCYSFLPKDGSELYNIGMMDGDEVWLPYKKAITSYAFRISRGDQRVDNSLMDSWLGNYQGGGPGDNYGLFKGIRVCNTFLANIYEVPDITSRERRRWIGEVQFLKAYYNFLLLRMYGPIPIVDKNLPVDASQSEVEVKRQPFDSCVHYIVNLIDTAATKLPDIISSKVDEEGRITRPAALGIKARVLLMAASPLFNGNSDYADFVGKDGTHLFNTTYDQNKWKKAAGAALEAIKAAESEGHHLYRFKLSPFDLTDTTITKLSIRQAICERWNPEIIWGNPNSTTADLQERCMPPLTGSESNDPDFANMIMSAPLKIAKEFYTKNGVPIEEDKDLDFSDLDALRTATHEERFNVKEGFTTARINFDRGSRFYADLAFDGSTWYKYDSPSQSDENTYYVEGKYGENAGARHAFFYNVTGYYIKKLVDWNQSTSESSVSYKAYPWPILSLDDEYLMYAEALNEAEGPSQKVYQYLDSVRARAGLDGVVKSWEDHSTNPSKPTTKDGLREIIHQERLIEMAFTGHRFWDLRRWKDAVERFNEPITGWNIYGREKESYYNITTVYQQPFVAPRDYLWPIPQSEIIKNPNLVQNPGW